MISVIVPVFNCAPWLERCVRSVIAPPGEEVEILLVDDGSTDGSPVEARRLAARDPRIRLFTSPRRGPGGARNVGLDHARGQWIFFLDADDMISPNALSLLLSAARKENAGIASAQIAEFHEGVTPRADKMPEEAPVIFTGREMAIGMLYQTVSTTSSSNGKLYSRALIADNRFLEKTLYEDLDFTIRIYMQAERVAALSIRCYYYFQRSGSIIHTFNSKRADVLTVVSNLLKEYEQAGDETMAAAARARLFGATCNICFLIRALPRRQRAPLRDLEGRCRAALPSLARQITDPRPLRPKNRLARRLILAGLLPLILPLARILYRTKI